MKLQEFVFSEHQAHQLILRLEAAVGGFGRVTIYTDRVVVEGSQITDAVMWA